MSFKRFISGVSAFAVAVTAFAAMAVTASAMDYINKTPKDGATRRVTAKGNGVYTTEGNSKDYSYIVADLSKLPGIDDAKSVTVEFDTKVIGNGLDKLAHLAYGVGDKSSRDLNCGGSGNGYKPKGLVTYFGSNDGSKFIMKGVNGSKSASEASNATVHAVVTLDREHDTYTARLTTNNGTTEIAAASGEAKDTSGNVVDNLTVVEAFTWLESSYDVTFKNIKVSYTAPDAPPTYVTTEVDAADNVNNDGVYAKAYTCDITYKGNSFNEVTVEVPGSKQGSQTLTTPVISGVGDVRIGIIYASKDSSKIPNTAPNVTVE